ncbi:MAG: GGDEF domain-containing protein [Chitinispirillales bacterium]|jgi:diguanylate cyclase (GGDEF)-like protein|nr:GGDEF domain-containing protein [Chitinispirillales bacterium]
MPIDKTGVNIEGRRPTLGFFVSELENPYAQTLVRGITDAAVEADANVIIFPGKSPKVPYNYRYQYNAIYKLATKDHIDALILATGTMVNFLSDAEFKDFYGRYSDIPLVSISIPLEGISSVLIDNKVGLRDVFEHLVDVHKLKKIAWIGGPESNVEAQERLQVYREVLLKHGLVYDESLVVTGDFTKYSGVRAIEEFLDVRKVSFEALAAANDEMALSAMEELQKRGYKIPQDIAVVGFDNVESAHYSSPSLTTVAQPIYEQAYNAVQLAFRLIGGRGAHNIALPTTMVLRESCGCFSQVASLVGASDSGAGLAAEEASNKDGADVTMTTILSKARGHVVDGKLDGDAVIGLLKELSALIDTTESDRTEKLRFWQNAITEFRAQASLKALSIDAVVELEDFFHKARMLLLEAYFKNDLKRWDIYHRDISGLRDVITLLISDVNNTKAALNSIIPGLREMGMVSFYVFLHDMPERHEISTDWNFRKNIILVVADDDRPGISKQISGRSMPVKSILDSSLYPQDRRYTFVASSLFYMNEHIGFVVCEPNFNDIYIFESLTVEISCSLKLINLVQTRQRIELQLQTALEELEKYNEQLSSISETDELTGLLNRRGFLNNARHMLSIAQRTKKGGILFFADLDGLKGINDTYGHEEGDNAIKVVASVLKKAFRESDALARLGGDEFTVLTLNSHPEDALLSMFEKRIIAYVDDYNKTSDKPYKVATSIGMVSFNYDDHVEIEKLMSDADALLYQQKKEKKKARGELPG